MTRDLDRAVTLFHSDAGPTELRVLGTRSGTVSGYFTDPDKLIAAARAWDGEGGVYVTLNPAVPEALARADNAVVRYAKHTTGDREIAVRRWLLIDLDPVRLPGIPSTAAEHEQALALARIVYAWLIEQGIPGASLVVTDSGNGAAILVRVDLPNDDACTSLVKRILAVVDRRFSTDEVKVDSAVFNAGRITRLPGTLNMKGSGTEDRPHRAARLLQVPNATAICPIEVIETIAALDPAPTSPDRPTDMGSRGSAFDLPRWLTEHGLAWSRKKPWSGGTLYLLEACPFDASHGANGEVHAGQYPSGAVDFACKHNSCTDKKWQDLRALLEPEYRDRRESYERRAREQDAGAAPGGSSGDRAGTENETHAPLRWRTAREIAESTPPEIPYRIMPFVADGAVTELDGKIKLAGKTTLVSHMVAAVLDGADFLGQPTVKTSVVWLTEQPDTSLRPVLERAGSLKRDDLVILTYWDACHLPWPQVVAGAVQKAAEIGARMLVVDTLGQFAGLAGDAENNAGDAQQAIKPLQIAAATHRLAVVVLRHEKKADADVGDAARGSTAIGGAVDVILSLRRVSGMPTTVRRLLALSRFPETPDETFVELTDRGYVIADVAGVRAAKKQAKTEGQRRKLLGALPADQAAALTVEELEKSTELPRSTVQALAKALYDEKLVDRLHDDKTSQKPYRYWRLNDINDDATPQATVGAEADEKAVEKGDEPSRASQDTFSVGAPRHKLDPGHRGGPLRGPTKGVWGECFLKAGHLFITFLISFPRRRRSVGLGVVLMTPAAIIATLHARGARLAVRPDNRITVTPRSVLDDDLRAALRTKKTAVLALLSSAAARDDRMPCDETCDADGERRTGSSPLPVDYDAIYATVAADAGTAEDLAAIAHHVDLNGFWVAQEVSWLDRRCDRLAAAGVDEATYRAAVVLLVARIEELRRWHLGTALPPASRRLAVERNAPVPAPVTLADGTIITNASFVGRLLTAVDYVLAYPGIAHETVLLVYVRQLEALGIHGRLEVVQ